MHETLLELCRQGDKNAQKQFYDKYVDRVFGICMRMMADREKAKDSVQETFIKAFARLEQFRSDAEIGTWLYRIAVNTCLDLLRRSRPGVYSIDNEESGIRNNPALSRKPDHDKSPIEEVVRKVLATINTQWAETFWLFTMHQLSQKDIAEMQKISLATVKMRLGKVREILKIKIKDI